MTLTLKDHQKEKKRFRQRLLLVSAFVSLLTAVLLGRLFYLQVLNHHEYTTLSDQNRLASLPLPPKRGLIYDRNGQLLADNQPVFSLDIRPDQVPDIKKTLKALSALIAISPVEKQTFLKQYHLHRFFESTPLKLTLSEAEMARFATQQYRFPGVHITARLIRRYPLGKLTAVPVGYVGRISMADSKRLDPQNYTATYYVGKAGIEHYYESTLHGKTGFQQVEINASGHVVRVIRRFPPVNGKDLHLTIDSRLQKAAQTALGSMPGAVVALVPKTGEVLALVSNPSFDPNGFVQGLSVKGYHALQYAKSKPLFNRAVQGQFPLASTIKPFLALEGLENNTITPRTQIYDPGWFSLPHSQHRYHDLGVHGWVNLHKAIKVSCDTFFYALAVSMGIEQIDDALHHFGFGEKTGLDLSEEQIGLVPSPEWKKRHQGIDWFTGDTIISGIGQGFMLTTPVQLAAATATLANRGKRVTPTLWYQPNKQSKGALTPPAVVLTQHPKAWETVIHAMEDVIRSPQGTGFRFGRHPAYTVAGKTGTAQLYHLRRRYDRSIDRNIDELPKALRDDSLFIAFAPVDHPAIAVAIVVEHAPDAPRIARKVMDAYLLNE